MDYFVVDFETFYDSKSGHTLSKQTMEEYINDPRFHVFGFSVKKNGGKSLWVPEEKVSTLLRQLKLHEHAVIMHNALFDAAILNWKYGIKPKFIVDTLAMARGALGNEESLSLSSLADRFGIGKKGDAVLHMDGVRQLSPQMMHKLGEYACNDADLTWELWLKLKEGFPKVELVVIDITTRMFSEPTFVLDKNCILRELELEEQKKEKLLAQAQCTMEDLRSDAKFAVLLENLGVDPPKKLSVKKTAAAQVKDPAALPVYTWAFAKSDPDFKQLQEHENEMVRWLVDARLGLKSTIKQSRAERFLKIADRMGVMPVALTYYGASTGRYSASSSEKVNMQNLPAARGSKDPDVGLLRKSLRAPDGKVVIVVDASQIEARLVAWQAGQKNLVEAFAQGRDVYSEMASVIFGRKIDRKKNPDDYIPGFIGKCVVLGCGYGMGHVKFGATIFSGMLGGPRVLFDDSMVSTLGVDLNDYARYVQKSDVLRRQLSETKPASVSIESWIKHAACSKRIIDTFRANNPAIPEYWKLAEEMLYAMWKGHDGMIGLFEIHKNFLVLPNGMKLYFKELEKTQDGFTCLRKKEGRVKRVKMYGGAVVENLSQALAGAYVKESMVRAYLKGYRPILQVHDEVVVVADESDAENAFRVVSACMETPPSWASGLPLASDGGFAGSYGECK